MTIQQLKEYCEAEFENIEYIFKELDTLISPNKSIYTISELAAIGTFMHNCYNGYENILKRIFAALNFPISNSSTWHKDLLSESLKRQIIHKELYVQMIELLSFRHFFVHGYSLDLKWESMQPLVSNLSSLHSLCKKDIIHYLDTI